MDCQIKKGLQKQKDVFEKGKDFVLVGESVDVTQNFTRIEFEDWVRTAAGIDNKEIVADLADLVEKHPEFYKRKSDVYRMILEVKNEPQFFLKNNNEKLALIVSKLKNGKLGKLGVEKNGVEVNQIRHAAMSSKADKDLARLKKRQAVGSPTPTLPTHEAKSSLGTTAGADAHSPASTKEIIAQKKSYSQKVDSFFKKAEEIIGAVDEAITTKATGGWAKRTLTVSETTKKIGEIINDFHVGQSQRYENASKLKEFLDKNLSPDESNMLFAAMDERIKGIELPEHMRAIYKQARAAVDTRGDKLVELGALKQENRMSGYIKYFYEQHLQEGGVIKKFYFDKRFKARKELTHDERIALGLIEDINFALPKTLAEMDLQILKAQTLKNIADTFGVDEAKDGFVRMSDETMGGGIYKYGALAGKYVPKEVANAVKQGSLVKENLHWVETLIYPLIDHIKVNLTVKNPFTHIYNIGSNLMLSYLHGDLVHVGKVLDMAMNDKKKFKALVERANKYGFNTSREMVENTSFAFGDKTEPMVVRIFKEMYMSKGSKGGDFVRNAYDWGDKVFKLASFYRLLEEGVDEKSAFKISQKNYVDYTTPVPAVLRVLDKAGLTPFIHYTYKATPMVMQTIAKHPVRYAILQAALMGSGASAWLGREEENKFLPEWAQSGFVPNLFGAKNFTPLGKSGWNLNTGRLVPGVRFDGFSLGVSGGFWGGAFNIVNGKSPLGYPIDKEYDSTATKIEKRLFAMGENYLPSMTLGRYGQRIVGKATGLKEPKNYYDEPMSYAEMVARGAGVRRFNSQKEVLKKAEALRRTLKRAEKKAKEEKNPTLLRDAQKEYKLELNKLRKPARDVRLDLSKF